MRQLAGAFSPHSAAAFDAACRARTTAPLVKALSSTPSAYSSAQTTLRIEYDPSPLRSARLAQKSATSRSSGQPSLRSQFRSPLMQ